MKEGCAMGTVNCPGCGTRVADQQRSCPNCGRNFSRTKRASAQAERRRVKRAVIPSPAPKPKPEEPEEIEVEIELDQPADPGDSSASMSSPDTGNDLGDTEAGPALNLPDPVQLREILAQDPDQLEEGLKVYTDKKGIEVGEGYETPVGEIDLLARDSNGSLVIVLVADPGFEADLVSQILQRIGWAQKHLEKRNQTVRGIILVETAPEALCYAASALGDNVTIRSYRMALTFDSVEL
jgi:hypothetical protein